MQSDLVATQLQDSPLKQSDPSYPTLNFDILHHIMAAAADKSIILSCMQTCRALNAAGVPILLRFPIKIRRHEQLASFCAFMLFKDPPRTQWLRQLQLSGLCAYDFRLEIEERDPVLDLLAQVLKRADHLEDLKIDAMEKSLERAPRLIRVLRNLTSVRSLSISDFGRMCCVLFLHMDIPRLRRLDLHLSGYLSLSDPLKPFQDHLEELHIRGSVNIYGFDFTMPRVTKLTLEDNDLLKVFVSPLLTSFPNLKSFGLITNTQPIFGHNLWESRHLLNQCQFYDDDWDQLSHVRGTELSLYVLGLNSSVEHLELVRFDEGSLPFLSTLLHDLRPTVLSLEMNTRRGFSLSSLASSDSFTFSKEILPPHVNLKFHISKESGVQNKIIVGPTY